MGEKRAREGFFTFDDKKGEPQQACHAEMNGTATVQTEMAAVSEANRQDRG